MVDELKTTETVETETQVITKTETVEELKARLEEAERRAKNKADEAERHFKKLAKFELEEAKRKEAEMSELDLANKHAKELEAQVKGLQFKTLQQEIAGRIGLPPVYADRIRGETPEDMEADAKVLMDALPKQKAAPNTGATAPGSNVNTGETEADKRRRLFG